MRDGKIVESGKYDELVSSGLDFGELVAAHETSMELVEAGADSAAVATSPRTPTSPHASSPRTSMESPHLSDLNDEHIKSFLGSHIVEDGSKLIKEEERETGQVSLGVYKQYCTEAYGWWGIVLVLFFSLTWQGSLMASDYWLAYETSAKNAISFDASVFILGYVIIALVSIVLVSIRSYYVTHLGLKTAQIFFRQILNSILHAPMSFFDTTPSGRILSRVRQLFSLSVRLHTNFSRDVKRNFLFRTLQASTDQTNVDILIPFMLGLVVSMYTTLLSIFIVTCQYAWPTAFFVIPLGWLNIWYRVGISLISCSDFYFF